MNNGQSILVIDDDLAVHKSFTRFLEPEFSIHTARSGPEGLEKIERTIPALVLLDLRMPQMSGMTVLKKLREKDHDIPVIMITAHGCVNSAVQAIKLGAVDYIEKPFDNEKLKQTLKSFLKKRKNVKELSDYVGIVGESPQIQKVWQLIKKYGPTDLPILLQGETGTGKELFAKAVHEISKRHQGPFVPIDCSVVPESLVESEIFGYERGAFTNANRSKPGRLEWANNGTLFLDEISNLPLGYQAKLLRVLQEQQYIPLGARESKSLDIRLVSACNIDLGQAIQQGNFRKDLFYRISAVPIELPPLRAREGDIELLAWHFVERCGRKYDKPNLEISDEAIDFLLSYQWPGNVRELEYMIAATAILADQIILPEHVRQNFQRREFDSDDDTRKAKLELNFVCDLNNPIDLKKVKEEVAAEVEKQILCEVKEKLSLNQTELADFLGIDPKTLRSKERMYDIHYQ